jgi:hypothetical protein
MGNEGKASLVTQNQEILVLRTSCDSDRAFIEHSWKKSLREYSPTLGNLAYYTLANAVCHAVLSADPILLIAHGLGANHVIRGWVCAEATPTATVLWMAYSKSWSRRQGVFTQLLQAATTLAKEEGAGEGKLFAFDTRLDNHLEKRGWQRISVAKALHLRDLHRYSESATQTG